MHVPLTLPSPARGEGSSHPVAATIAWRSTSTMRSSDWVGVISGGAMQIVSPIAGSAPPARRRKRTPRCSASRMTLGPSPIAG